MVKRKKENKMEIAEKQKQEAFDRINSFLAEDIEDWGVDPVFDSLICEALVDVLAENASEDND